MSLIVPSCVDNPIKEICAADGLTDTALWIRMEKDSICLEVPAGLAQMLVAAWQAWLDVGKPATDKEDGL